MNQIPIDHQECAEHYHNIWLQENLRRAWLNCEVGFYMSLVGIAFISSVVLRLQTVSGVTINRLGLLGGGASFLSQPALPTSQEVYGTGGELKERCAPRSIPAPLRSI